MKCPYCKGHWLDFDLDKNIVCHKCQAKWVKK